MHIQKLELQNFRCYKQLEIDFEKKLTVIVGENGRGKTAIFDGVAIGLESYLAAFKKQTYHITAKDVHRAPIHDAQQRLIGMETRLPVGLKLEVVAYNHSYYCQKCYDEKGEHILEDTLGNLGTALAGTNDKTLPVLAYYGTSRLWQDSDLLIDKHKSLEDRAVGYEECLEPSASFNTFGKWLEHISQQDGLIYKMIQTAILNAVDSCLKSTGLHGLYYNSQLKALVINHPDMGEQLVSDLSDGVRTIISIAVDIAYRMIRLNSHLGNRVILDTPGVVFIDEIDMHLHPLWQQFIIHDLQTTFPSVQFIVTTHSPQVLSTVPPEAIRILVWDKDFKGVFNTDFSLGAESNQLLQDIQNVNTRPKELPIVKKLDRYLELVTQDKWDTEEALKLRQELDAWSKGREPLLVKADMDIRMRQFRRSRQ